MLNIPVDTTASRMAPLPDLFRVVGLNVSRNRQELTDTVTVFWHEEARKFYDAEVNNANL